MQEILHQYTHKHSTILRSMLISYYTVWPLYIVHCCRRQIYNDSYWNLLFNIAHVLQIYGYFFQWHRWRCKFLKYEREMYGKSKSRWNRILRSTCKGSGIRIIVFQLNPLRVAMLLRWKHDVMLTHWGRGTHICVGKLIIIGSDNGLSPGWFQAII